MSLWSTGSNRLHVTNTGSVGIGTTVPGTLLDVAGAITSRPSGVASGNTGQLILRELAANGTNTAIIRSPDALAADYVLTLPIDDGTSGQVLQTDGSGVLSWTSGASSIGVDALDFDKIADSMTLDASTDIAVSGTNVLSVTNSGTGNSFVVNDQAADTSPFVIDASGYVGIGTTGPTDRLHVYGGDARLDGNLILTGRGQLRTGTNPSDIRLTANGNLEFSPGAALSMHLSSSGNVGIGTTNPSYPLHVVGNAYLAGAGNVKLNVGDAGGAYGSDGGGLFTLGVAGQSALRVWNSTAELLRVSENGNVGVGTTLASNLLHARISDAGTNTVTNVLRLEHESSGTPAASYGTGILFTGESDTTSNQDMAQVDAIWTTATNASRASAIRFSTVTAAGALSEKMRIDGSGFVGINNPAPSVALDVTGDIEYSGTLTDVSDRRLKKDILPLNNSLEKLLAVDGVSFVMKDDPKERKEIGVIAQDVESILPELVRTKNDALQTKSVNYMGFIGYLIEGIKELYYNLSQKDKQHDEEIEKLKIQNQQLLELVQKQQQQIDQIQKNIQRNPATFKK